MSFIRETNRMMDISRLSRFLFGLALAFLLISVAMDLVPAREEPDLDRDQRYSGTEPWAVANVRPGDALTAHLARLGAPDQDRTSSSGRGVEWTRHGDLKLSVNREDEIFDVWGRSLTAGPATLIQTGLSQVEVERILGRGEVRRSTQPGSGVISLGSKEVARILSYENDGVRFEITLQEDSVKHVRAVKITSAK